MNDLIGDDARILEDDGADGGVAAPLPGLLLGEAVPADAAAKGVGEASVDHLGQAAQLFADRLRLADQDGEDAVFGALAIDEVVAEDFDRGLELAVDPTVALLHAAGVPGH